MHIFYLRLRILFILLSSWSFNPTAFSEQSISFNELIGKTKTEVIESIGEPDRFNKYNSEGIKKEQWTYFCEYFSPCALSCERYHRYPCYYLFFVDDKLQSFHDTR